MTYDPNRYVIEYDFTNLVDETKVEKWIQSKIGTEYDLLSFALWIFGINLRHRMHCFDTVLYLLEYLKYPVSQKLINRPTGDRVRTYLDALCIPRRVLKCKEIN